MLENIENPNKIKDGKQLLEFVEKAIYLSQQCQIDGLHNANWLLPTLVETTFEEDYIHDVYNRLNK